MAYCMKCGTQLPEGSPVCPNCGAAAGVPPQAYQPASGFKTDFTDEMSAQDIEKGRVVAMLSYLNTIFCILALIAEPDNKFVRFHVNQALVLQVTGFIAMLCAIVPFIGWLVAAVASIVLFVFAIIGLFNAKAGRAKELPVIGKYRALK